MPIPTDYRRLAVATNIAVFTLRDEELKLLLVRRGNSPFKGVWGLPGGLVGENEDIDTNAMRKLEEGAGVTGTYLEQLCTFGASVRDPRERVIAVAYYALIPSDRLQLRAVHGTEGVAWFAMDELPGLAFDHAEMVRAARQRLASKLAYSTIALQFMPEKFTLSELQSVYELILDESLDKRNFRKRAQGLDQLRQTNEWRRNGNHRPARLYRVSNPGEVQFTR